MHNPRVRLKISKGNQSLFQESGLLDTSSKVTRCSPELEIALQSLWMTLEKELAQKINENGYVDPVVVAKAIVGQGIPVAFYPALPSVSSQPQQELKATKGDDLAEGAASKNDTDFNSITTRNDGENESELEFEFDASRIPSF